jgi:hypothetical protein
VFVASYWWPLLCIVLVNSDVQRRAGEARFRLKVLCNEFFFFFWFLRRNAFVSKVTQAQLHINPLDDWRHRCGD